MGCCSSGATYAEGEEYFVKCGTSIINSGKRVEGTGATSYGAIIIDPNAPNTHEWVFRITSGGGIFLIGIDDASMKSCNQIFSPQAPHANYGYFNGDTRSGSISSYNVTNKESIYGKGYAIMNHCNDVITMIFDTSTATLKYFVNDKYQGMAFRNIRNDCQYRMAIYMTGGKADAVIELLHYSCLESTGKREEKVDANGKGEEYFYKSHSDELVISDDGYIATNSGSARNTSVYGSILTNIDKKGIYHWRFKICGDGKTGFGVIECTEKDILPPFSDSYDDFFYLQTSLKNYGIESAAKCSSNQSYQYGIAFQKNDIIEVILDFDGGYLSFCVNDKSQGNAYRVEEDTCYRMAVVLGSDSQIELLSFHCE